MKSDRLTLSNRVNARKSTGPRSAAGKAASSMNRLTTGMFATSLIILGEDPADFDKLTQEYYESKFPATPEERFHLDVMIRSEWQLRRFDSVERQLWEYRIQETLSRTAPECALGKIYYNGDVVFSRLERQRSTVYRTYKEASAELASLQSARYELDEALRAESEAAAQPHPAPETPSAPAELIATEATYQQIGFVPSNIPTASADPLPAAPEPALSPVVPIRRLRAHEIMALSGEELRQEAARRGLIPSK